MFNHGIFKSGLQDQCLVRNFFIYFVGCLSFKEFKTPFVLFSSLFFVFFSLDFFLWFKILFVRLFYILPTKEASAGYCLVLMGNGLLKFFSDNRLIFTILAHFRYLFSFFYARSLSISLSSEPNTINNTPLTSFQYLSKSPNILLIKIKCRISYS